MTRVACLHATRERPEYAFETAVEWWISRSSGEHKIIYVFSLDSDDPTLEEYKDRYFKLKESAPKHVQLRLISGDPPNNNAAWNRAYWAVEDSIAREDVVVQVSDDFEAPVGWDVEAVKRIGCGFVPGILGVGIPRCTEKGQLFPVFSGEGTCLEIIVCNKAFCQEQGGFLLYPEYLSMLSDDDITMKGAMDGSLVDAYDFLFCHHWHGAKEDPLCDDIYTRHHDHECWQNAHEVFPQRQSMLYPDVTLYGDINRDIAKDRWLVPPPVEESRHKVAEDRRARGWARIQNKPFGDIDNAGRKFYYAAYFKEARELLEKCILSKYHFWANDKRFLFHSGIYMWNNCSVALGEPKRDTRDREFWDKLLKPWRPR